MTIHWNCPTTSVALLAGVLFSATPAVAQQPAAPPTKTSLDPSTMDLEQLMKIEVVVAGSKRPQQARDVASFVSVVTAAEIKQHGYRTLSAVLKTLPSFYLSDDRNYTFLGVRGFERSGDYNSRVLLLLNGQRTNDNVYDQAYLGQELGIDMDVIDRIEVIRGPSAALYGSNAFFAVINLVTKPGATLQGGEVAASAASYGTHGGRASYGKSLSDDADFLVSASLSDSKGQQFYFPEFDNPATNNGIATNADHERFYKLLATATKGYFSFQAINSSREKGVPTASFGTLFNDNRTHTIDGMSLASASYNRSFSQTSLSTRISGGRWTYRGAYAFVPDLPPNVDIGYGEWWGANVDAAHTFSRHLLTIGGEFQDNFRQNQKNFDPQPYVLYTDVRNESLHGGVFAQDEIKLLEPLTLYAGVRLDQYEGFGSATSPRLGLIYTPTPATTVKLLAGRAFRAPNDYELHFESNLFKPNPRLEPEHIETLELVAEHLIGGVVQVSASAFRNRLSELINQRVDSSDNMLIFENADAIESKGMELGLRVNRGHGPSGGITYALQRTEDRATGVELTNSPRQMAKAELRAPLNVRNITAGIDAQYVSGRQTIAGSFTAPEVVTNISLLAPAAFHQFDVSATIYNLFAVKYGIPGSDEHLQNTIPQDGRSFRFQTTLHF